ncbi:hypothetical protein LCGC14_0556830 [marine sediment metagenome]|uniref:YiaAB two helix domain-containing protein n=1 Tax=marine sediment metagenome TaxID=412755 RepID=A0A0F9RN94_9ZZZZ
MTQTKLTILGYGIGVMVVVGSFFRWTIYYSDLKQSLIGIGLGFMALGFAYLYQRITELTYSGEDNKKELEEDMDGLGRGLEALRKWTVDAVELESKKKK